MTTENPTADSGASIEQRLERFLEPEAAPQEEANTQGQQSADPDNVTPEAAVEKQPADDAQADSDEPQIALSDVAQYLGVDEALLDVSEDGEILYKTKIDGQEGTAKLADLVKSYQLQGHVDTKARQAAEVERALQERVQQFETHAQTEFQRFEQLAQVANHVLMQDFGNIDWQTLARTDPADFIARKADFEARQGQVQQLMQAVQHQGQQLQQAKQGQFQQKVQKAAEKIAADVEGWQSGNEIDLSLQKFAHENGFQDTANIMAEYPQAAKILWEAMQYRAGKQTASVTEKKIRTAPKLIRPGQSTDAKQRSADTTRGLKEQVRKSGGKQGVAEYLMATGKV